MCSEPGCRPATVSDYELLLRELADGGVPASPSEDRLMTIARLALKIARQATCQLPYDQRPF